MDEKLLKKLLSPVVEQLKPAPTMASTLPYDTFSKPFMTYAKGIADQQKPWYEYFTAEPFKQRLRGTLAAGGRTGFSNNVVQRQLRELYQPLNESISGQGGILEAVRSQLVNPLYKQRIGQIYGSPVSGFNF